MNKDNLTERQKIMMLKAGQRDISGLKLTDEQKELNFRILRILAEV